MASIGFAERRKRGLSFTPEEDLALSRAVSSVALSTEDMLLTV